MVRNDVDEGVDEIKLLQSVIHELQRLYDNVATSFAGLRSRALALLGGEIAVASFLFGTDYSFKNLNVIDDLVFLFAGILLLLIALILLLMILQPTAWNCPPDTKDTNNLKERFDNSELLFLRYIKSEYEEAIEDIVRVTNLRSSLLTWALRSLSIGILILLVLKYL